MSGHRGTGRNRDAQLLWLPEAYRELYDYLLRIGITTAEAKRMVLEQIVVDERRKARAA